MSDLKNCPRYLRREYKKQEVKRHNEAYEAKRLRWSKMTKEERRTELVAKGVNSAIKQLRPDIDNMLGLTT